MDTHRAKWEPGAELSRSERDWDGGGPSSPAMVEMGIAFSSYRQDTSSSYSRLLL